VIPFRGRLLTSSQDISAAATTRAPRRVTEFIDANRIRDWRLIFRP
jgi:hypothetical protein